MVTYTYSGTNTTPTSQAIYAIEADHLGTPRRVSDSQNRTRWTWNPAPYGDTLPSENPSALGSFTLNLRFPGQYFDKETNTHYNHHRDYEATQGRYLQSDPIGLQGGVNTYAYALNRPTSLTDPTGEFVPAFAGAIWAYRAYLAYRAYRGTAAAIGVATTAAAAVSTSSIELSLNDDISTAQPATSKRQ
jgi:RHS repeat-associated protein